MYKQVSVVGDDTNENPIFLGPVFIHDNSDFVTDAILLAHTDTSKLVIGSDEEGCIVNAITNAFSNSRHILCTSHIEKKCEGNTEK